MTIPYVDLIRVDKSVLPRISAMKEKNMDLSHEIIGLNKPHFWDDWN